MTSALQSKVKTANFLTPFAATSDGKTSSYVDYNGFNRIFITVQAGIQTTGDSADTVTWQLYRIDDIAAASAAASDHVAITAGVVTMAAPADSDTAWGIGYLDIDCVAHTLDNGCLAITATPSPGAVVPVSAIIQLYNKNGKSSDTSMTIVTPASS